jgi:hypothetical protein
VVIGLGRDRDQNYAFFWVVLMIAIKTIACNQAVVVAVIMIGFGAAV